MLLAVSLPDAQYSVFVGRIVVVVRPVAVRSAKSHQESSVLPVGDWNPTKLFDPSLLGS